jgi:hypothetical protein
MNGGSVIRIVDLALHRIGLRWSLSRRGASRPVSEAFELGLIDPRITSLVRAMNVEGVVSTLFCCEGHWPTSTNPDGRDTRIDLPYVAFKSDIDFAARLNRALVAHSPLINNRLNLHWIVEYGPMFTLRSHLPAFPCEQTRQQLDQDFATIEALVADLVGTTHR